MATFPRTLPLFELTFDFKRTESYAGTVLTQTIVSGLWLAPPAVFIGIFGAYSESIGLFNLIVNSVHIICTLYLSISLLLFKYKYGAHALWKSNAKDVMLGSCSSQSYPSWFGCPRNPPLRKRDVSRFPHFWTNYVPKILFRRVSPVESKRYAFFQNSCALLFIIAIIIRAVMALTQAQNQVETRSGVQRCILDNLPSIGNFRLLVRHQDIDKRGSNPQSGQGYDVNVQITTRKGGNYQCTSKPQYASHGVNWFQVFSCGSQKNADTPFSDGIYAITIRSTNGTSLDAIRLPDIWFSNFADSYQDSIQQNFPDFAETSRVDRGGFMGSIVPWLIPPWQMIGGKDLKGSVGLVERRFITSSVLRDIFISLKPTYSSASLFTITTKDASPLADSFTASATLTPSLMPSLAYLNDPAGFLWTKRYPTSLICAFIEDYRSSTIFDAIGSIGGLLAILQGMHIMLFGRPMFWGLTGAKLINPFGLFGRCHSRAFRRRLREQYHRQPTGGQAGDAAEAIRISAFLRDFVIEFGPADVEDTEAGRSGKELRLQASSAGSRRAEEYDTNNSFFSSAAKPTATTTPGTFGGSLFGQTNTTQTQTPATGGLFGAQNQTQTQSQFGVQAAGNATNTTGGLFGAQPAASTAGTTGGLFGAQPAAGTGAATATTGGLFGTQPAAQPAATTTTGGLFGQPQTQQQQSSFSFGGASTTPAPAQQQAQATGPFTRTTKFNDLPDVQKKTFEDLESFIQGRVQISVELKAQKLGEDIAKENVMVDELKKSLAAAGSALAADRLAADDQRTKTEQNLQDALAATRIIDGFTRPQQHGNYLTSYANFPLEFFARQVDEMKERVQRYKSTMEQIERKLTVALESHTPQPAQPSPQAIANALRAQHQSFMALAARTAEIDATVQRHKTAYTARWRAQTGSARDPFAAGSGKEDEMLDALMGMSVSMAGR